MTLSSIWAWMKTNIYIKATILTLAFVVAFVVCIVLIVSALWFLIWLSTDGTWLILVFAVGVVLGFVFGHSYFIVQDAQKANKSVLHYLWDSSAHKNDSDNGCGEA